MTIEQFNSTKWGAPEEEVILHEDSRNGINPIKLTPFVNMDGKVTNVYIGNIKII